MIVSPTQQFSEDVVVYGLHHPGKVRAQDQDFVLSWDIGGNAPRSLERDECTDARVGSRFLSPLRFFAVADGMGGLEDGARTAREAAEAALEAFRERAVEFDQRVANYLHIQSPNSADVADWSRPDIPPLPNILLLEAQRLMLDVIHSANQSILPWAESKSGCTLLIAAIADYRAYIAYVGDSRAYLIRPDGTAKLLTSDHNEAWNDLMAGNITDDEAISSGRASRLTQYVGLKNINPDWVTSPLGPGDRLVLCTDGLYGSLKDDRLLGKLAVTGSPEQAANELLEATLQHGAKDNVGVVVVQAPARKVVRGRRGPESSRRGDRQPLRWGARTRQLQRRLSAASQGPRSAMLLVGVVLVTLAALLAAPPSRAWLAGNLGLTEAASPPISRVASPTLASESPTPPTGAITLGAGVIIQPPAGREPVSSGPHACPMDRATYQYVAEPGDTIKGLAEACGFAPSVVANINHIPEIERPIPVGVTIQFPLPTATPLPTASPTPTPPTRPPPSRPGGDGEIVSPTPTPCLFRPDPATNEYVCR